MKCSATIESLNSETFTIAMKMSQPSRMDYWRTTGRRSSEAEDVREDNLCGRHTGYSRTEALLAFFELGPKTASVNECSGTDYQFTCAEVVDGRQFIQRGIRATRERGAVIELDPAVMEVCENAIGSSVKGDKRRRYGAVSVDVRDTPARQTFGEI